jgi:predicted GH43/DUF377 family glycosyl hydrolase
MRHLIRISILFTLLLTGCSTASTPTPGMIQTSKPNPTLTAEPSTFTPAPTTLPEKPTPTQLPNAIPTDELNSSLFHFYEGNPVLQHSGNIQWDAIYIDPGGMIYKDGLFHMFFNGINGFPASIGVGYATSTDGYHWTRQVNEPILRASNLRGTHLIGNNLFVTSTLVEDDGTWVLYFYTLSGGTFNGPGDIGRATASSPTGPWTIDPEPLLSPGASGEWDDVQVNGPNVLKTDNGYIMYYDGHGSESTSRIGMATSSDGIHWTKYNDPATTEPAFAESDPVLTVSSDGWDSTRVIDPNVVQTSDGWVMIYLATTGTGKFAGSDFSFGTASSTDGIHWEKSAQNPILSNKERPQWSATYLATLLHVEDTYYLYFDFVSPSTKGTNVYLATYTGALK